MGGVFGNGMDIDDCDGEDLEERLFLFGSGACAAFLLFSRRNGVWGCWFRLVGFLFVWRVFCSFGGLFLFAWLNSSGCLSRWRMQNVFFDWQCLHAFCTNFPSYFSIHVKIRSLACFSGEHSDSC